MHVAHWQIDERKKNHDNRYSGTPRVAALLVVDENVSAPRTQDESIRTNRFATMRLINVLPPPHIGCARPTGKSWPGNKVGDIAHTPCAVHCQRCSRVAAREFRVSGGGQLSADGTVKTPVVGIRDALKFLHNTQRKIFRKYTTHTHFFHFTSYFYSTLLIY